MGKLLGKFFSKVHLSYEEKSELNKIRKKAFLQEAQNLVRIEGVEQARKEFGD